MVFRKGLRADVSLECPYRARPGRANGGNTPATTDNDAALTKKIPVEMSVTFQNMSESFTERGAVAAPG